MNLLDNRLSAEKRIELILVEVRQQIAGASLSDDRVFSCLIMLRSALQSYVETDPSELDGMYSMRCSYLGDARDHMERAVARYGMHMLSQFVPVLERIGAQKHNW
jgi:hypothetical protein